MHVANKKPWRLRGKQNIPEELDKQNISKGMC